jgi:hypothetical protein
MITRTLATNAVHRFQESEYYADDLTVGQTERLISAVMNQRLVDGTVPVEIIASIAAELFPENTDTRRPPLRKAGSYASERVTPPRQEQSQAEKNTIIAAALGEYWDRYFASLEPIFTPDGKGINPKARLSHMAVVNMLNGLKGPITINRVLSEIARLAANGLMQAKETPPKVVEKIVVAPPPDAAEIRRKQLELERKMNEAPAIKGRGKVEDQKPRPVVLTEPEKAALSARNDEQNAILSEAQSRIQGYSGHTHSKTYSGRAVLTELFTQGVHAGLDAKQILDSVISKIDQLAGSSSVR